MGHALGLPCGDEGRGGQTLRTHSVVHSPAASAPSRAPRKKCRVSGSALVLLKEKLHFNKIPEGFPRTLGFEKEREKTQLRKTRQTPVPDSTR